MYMVSVLSKQDLQFKIVFLDDHRVGGREQRS